MEIGYEGKTVLIGLNTDEIEAMRKCDLRGTVNGYNVRVGSPDHGDPSSVDFDGKDGSLYVLLASGNVDGQYPVQNFADKPVCEFEDVKVTVSK